ncbi:hypothetical protein ACH46N_31275 [Streptomyces pristinaespiralis]|uniref:Membrane protein n=1 Tax=Streptomyces pristinaespiralis TaxID=38300 RepID=A0A0M4DSU8_STRPR|nr:hypothetical protein [Streptomyces pristinaespiralis]ALC21757.1 membrane protein [Streptomyces pristinaespiralis]QMU15552.1 hypothetical protein H3L99_19725 [Streptomyces pristinaespiralis]
MLNLVRTSAVAAGLVAALALTGCGSGESDDAGKDKATASPTDAGGDSSGGGEGRPRDIEGTWTGLSDGKPVALSVQGSNAAIVADGHACTGEVQDTGKQMLALKCADGNTDRTMGSIESNDGTTLVISWDAGKKDTLKKSEAGALPDGLPTGMPTNVPAP